MAIPHQTLEQIWRHGTPCPFDEVIDVRSPREFAEDHIPGAINLPVLSDLERAEVGTLHAQTGAFAARRLGAAIVSRNIGQHLATHFSAQPREYHPLLYCWRGGQRSASLATILAAVGWRVTVLKGGYKTYRAHVLRGLDSSPQLFRYRLLAGMTGTAKTQILQRLAARGEQVLDLEQLANHRGSVLGQFGHQPTQKSFDSQLLAALEQLRVDRPVWVEAESNRIGNVYLPQQLWKRMNLSDGVEIRMPMSERVAYLIREYAHHVAQPDQLKHELRRLTSQNSSKWMALIDRQEWSALVEDLLASHYDPGYAASQSRCFPHVMQRVVLPTATDAALDELAAELTVTSETG
jgi:tRNA 2-selenouridine synthase